MNTLELAKEAGFDVDEGLFPFEAAEDKFIGTERVLERFAALVRAEYEAPLKLAEEALAIDGIYSYKNQKALASIREALAEQPLLEPEGRCKECMAYNGHLDYCSKAEPVKQEPVAFMFKVKRTTAASTVMDEFAAIDYFPQDNEEIVSKEPLSYAAPVDAKAIRAEALEEAEEIAKTIGGSFADKFLAAIRGLK